MIFTKNFDRQFDTVIKDIVTENEKQIREFLKGRLETSVVKMVQ